MDLMNYFRIHFIEKNEKLRSAMIEIMEITFLSKIEFLCILYDASMKKNVWDLSDLVKWISNKTNKSIFTVSRKLYDICRKEKVCYMFNDIKRKNYLFNNYRKLVRLDKYLIKQKIKYYLKYNYWIELLDKKGVKPCIS